MIEKDPWDWDSFPDPLPEPEEPFEGYLGGALVLGAVLWLITGLEWRYLPLFLVAFYLLWRWKKI